MARNLWVKVVPYFSEKRNQMQPSSKISIIIPCYNDHLFIEQALDSALAQTWSEKEIIVIDDGSNTETKNKLKSLAPKIDIIISQENRGVSAARNNGIAAATGTYILILDSDDFYEQDFCEKAIKVIENDITVKLVTCYARWFNEDSTYKIFKPRGGDLKDFLKKNCALASFFRKSDWELIEGYDEKMKVGFEDWEFYIRLLSNGGKAFVIPEVLYHYRNKAYSRNYKANFKKYALMEYIYLKNKKVFIQEYDNIIKYLILKIKEEEDKKVEIINSTGFKIGNFYEKIWRKRKLDKWFKKKK